MTTRSVLCVCTGNICRSPLAERLLARALPELTVASAGIGALAGHPMASPAAAIALRDNLTPIHHAARQLTPTLVRQFDLILVMEATQQAWIEQRYPKSRGRVCLISYWEGGEDVEDPYQQSAAVFESIYAQLISCVEDWHQRLSS